MAQRVPTSLERGSRRGASFIGTSLPILQGLKELKKLRGSKPPTFHGPSVIHDDLGPFVAYDLALGKHNPSTGCLCGKLDVVGHEQNGLPLVPKFLDQSNQFSAKKLVLTCCGFIQDNQFRLTREGRGEADALLLTFTETKRRALQERAQLKPFEKDVAPGRIVRFEDSRACQDFIANRRLKELIVGILPGETDMASELRDGRTGRIAAQNSDGATLRLQKPVQMFDQGRLSCSVAAHEGNAFPSVESHVNVTESKGLLVAERHVLHFDNGFPIPTGRKKLPFWEDLQIIGERKRLFFEPGGGLMS